MKKGIILLGFAVLLGHALPLSAQRYEGTLHDFDTAHGLYSVYFSLRAGMPASWISGNSAAGILTKGKRTSFFLEGIAGFELTESMPLFVETGLGYFQKGGTLNGNSIHLNYLQVPASMKYIFQITPDFSVQPLVGLYAAYGIGGRSSYDIVKASFDSQTHPVTEPSFRNAFRRWDLGLRLGCSVTYRIFSLELIYMPGLLDIAKDMPGSLHNRAISLSLGASF